MEHLCTICCKRKRREARPLPAIERYLGRRIRFVAAQSGRLGMPLVILSGKYGLLGAQDEVPWYDQVLLPEAVDAMVPKVVEQLAACRASALLFYARPRSTPGWEPYYQVLEKACSRLGIPLQCRVLEGFVA